MQERIKSAFGELSRDRGFYNATMDELALRAGMSKRTIYRYFNSKEEIVEAVLEDFKNGISREIDRLMADNAGPEALFTSIFNYLTTNSGLILNPLVLRDLRQHYPHLWARIDEFRARKIERVIKSLLAGSEDEKMKQMDPVVISTAVIASIQAVVNPFFILDNDLTPERVARQTIDFFMYGLLGRK